MTRSNRLGQLIDELGRTRNEIRDLDDKHKVLSAKRKELEAELLSLLDGAGMQRASTHGFTASVHEEQVAQVKDWDAFHAYVVSSNKPYLLQRRVTNKAWLEDLENSGEVPPGTEPFTQRKLYLRAL